MLEKKEVRAAKKAYPDKGPGLLRGGPMGLEAEERHLRLVDDHLAKSAVRIWDHEKRVEKMERDGLDTTRALTLLTLMRQSQRLMQAHREQILEAIAGLTRGSR
jgi:hypothetical protein